MALTGTTPDCVLEDGILVIRMNGVPEVKDFVALIEECYSKFTFKHALWDYTNSSLSGLSATSFKSVGEASAKFAGKRGNGARTAVIVGDESEILLMAAFNGINEHRTPVVFKAFEHEADAKRWLLGED